MTVKASFDIESLPATDYHPPMTASTRQEWTIDRSADGASLQDFLAGKLKLSKRRSKQLLDARQVWVNGKLVWMAHHRLRHQDIIEAIVAPELSAKRAKPIRILIEKHGFLVIDKPAGLLTLGKQSAEERLRRQTGNPALRVVHRLDRDTSGCLLVAIDEAHFQEAVAIFKTRRVRKVYQAIVASKVLEARFTIDLPLDEHPAKTHVKRIRTNPTAGHIEVRIETGRTHQIRRHLAMVRLPVVGDRRYGLKTSRDPKLQQATRQMLHSVEVEMPLPGNKGSIRAFTPLPGDFHKCLKRLRLT